MKLTTAEQMKELDRQAIEERGIPSIDLMERAAAVGVWLHGRAGDLAAERLTPYGMTPEDVVSSLPAAIGEIL